MATCLLLNSSMQSNKPISTTFSMSLLRMHRLGHVAEVLDCLQEAVRMKTVLAEPLSHLQQTARRIAEISNECKVDVNEDEYVESFQPLLMDVVHAWSKVSPPGCFCFTRWTSVSFAAFDLLGVLALILCASFYGRWTLEGLSLSTGRVESIDARKFIGLADVRRAPPLQPYAK